jgi:hypothetical protein
MVVSDRGALVGVPGPIWTSLGSTAASGIVVPKARNRQQARSASREGCAH